MSSPQPGAEAETVAKRVSDALGAILQQSPSGAVSKTDQARRVRAVKSFEKANRRAVELIEQAEEALEEEKRQRQHQHELAVEEKARRRDSEERAQEGEERRKDVRLILEAEERLTACRDRSRRENALLVSTLVCVLATAVLLFVTVLRGDPLMLGGPAFTSLLSAAGGYLLHSSAAVTSGS